MPTPQGVQRILWIDGLAALSAGGFVLVFREFLAELYAIPLTFITFVGLVNVGYSTFGLTLAAWKRRRVGAVMALSILNGLWACVCMFLIVQFRRQASVQGLAHLLFEGLFVAALASLEWRHRRALARHRATGTCHATFTRAENSVGPTCRGGLAHSGATQANHHREHNSECGPTVVI